MQKRLFLFLSPPYQGWRKMSFNQRRTSIRTIRQKCLFSTIISIFIWHTFTTIYTLQCPSGKFLIYYCLLKKSFYICFCYNFCLCMARNTYRQQSSSQKILQSHPRSRKAIKLLSINISQYIRLIIVCTTS